MLKLKNVSKYYYQEGVVAQGFTKINLELHLGEFVVITGESGSGKSTLLNVLSGLDSYEEGEMYINGEETSHYTEEDYLNYRRKYVNNIFQNFNLINSYTVYENIELAMLTNGRKRRDVKKYIDELIDKVDLKKYRNTQTSKLSGGQKQRVAIARALANDTPILVADEPTGSLDSESSTKILKLLHEISKEKLVIVVTHQKDEIEKYATRLIRMHDGKILENKVVNKINLDDNLKEKEVKNITYLNKIRLGIRNAFNIPVKFILMFIIFLLITVTLITNYAAFKMAEYEEVDGSFNAYFYNDSDTRIILTKINGEIFTESDYETIKNLDNISAIVEQDLINDYEMYLDSNSLYLNGKISAKEIINVNYGNVPQNNDEIVIIGNEDNWYFKNYQEELLNNNFNLENTTYNQKLKIVGIKYDNSMNDYEVEFYLNDNLLNTISRSLNKEYTVININLNNNYFSNNGMYYLNVEASDKINDGEVYIKDELNGYCKNYNCLNSKLNITVNNIYYQDSMDLKITSIFNKDNTKKLLDINYDDVYSTIFISNSDFDRLFNKGNYQSSVFVKEIKDLDNTIINLNNLGYNTLKLRDTKHNDAELIMQIFKIFRLIVVIALVVTLFFISYFIMKIIYKSRNSYFTTLRTLGSTKNVCVNILTNELITLASITYLIFLIFIYLVSHNIIKFEYFNNLSNYVTFREYLIVYLILILLSILMSKRYGRKIFKNSIIKTYGERI